MAADLGHPDDTASGFWGLFGKLEKATDSGAAIARNIAAGKQSLQDVQQDEETHKLKLELDRLKVERGDNRLIYVAVAVAGVAALVALT